MAMIQKVRRLIPQLFIIASLCVVSIIPAFAAWNPPSCNPDAGGGPTDASCNVSAPLNVSSSAQTKTGQLTIQNTVNGGALNVSNAYGGNGNIVITTSSGKSLNIIQNDGTKVAIGITLNSTQPGIAISQTGAGQGVSAATVDGTSFNATNNSTTNPTANFANSNTSSASGLTVSNNSAGAPAIYATNANASAFGAVRACMGSTNCALLGSSAAAGYFDGMVNVGSSGTRVSGVQALSVYSSGSYGLYLDNTNASGQGLVMNQTGNTSKGISITDNGNSATGIDIIMNGTTGTGIAVNSTGGTGGQFSTGAAAGSAVLAQNTSTGVGITVTSNAGKTIYATSTSGTTIDATSSSGAAGSFNSGAAAGNALIIQNTSTGSGLGVSTGGVAVNTIALPPGWPASGGFGIRGTSSTSYAIGGYSTAATGYGAGVYGRATSDYGVVAVSDASYGLFADSQSSSFYGSASCNTMTANCAYLGGGTYAGNFAGRVSISASVSNNPVAVINNTNTGAPYGYALSAHTMTGSLTPITVTQGTAIDAQAYNGYGLSAYSQNGAAGLYAESGKNTGYGGYFVGNGGTSSAAIYATNTVNAGKGIVVSTQGVGLDITTNTLTADGTGIIISASGGQKGIVIDASSTGIDVDSTSDTGIEANDTNLKTTGAYFGGQFYPGGTPNSSIYADAAPSLISTSSATTSVGLSRPHGMFFDGSDIWMPGADASGVFGDVAVQRINAYNGNLSAAYSPGNAYAGTWYPGAMVYADDTVYVFNGTNNSTEYMKLHPYADGTTSATFASAISISAAAYDGTNIWLGTDTKIYTLNVATGTRTQKQTGLGAIYDMIYAGGYIWALDYDNGAVYQVNSSGTTVATITVGTHPVDMEFDGAFIWVANDGDQTLTRININTNNTSTTNLSSQLSTGIGPLAFDGSHIWLIDGSNLYSYDIRSASLSSSFALSASSYTDLIFDGTYLWAGNGVDVDKIAIGGGRGYSMPAYPHGMILYGDDGNYHCVYFDGAGAIQDSTTLTNCR